MSVTFQVANGMRSIVQTPGLVTIYCMIDLSMKKYGRQIRLDKSKIKLNNNTSSVNKGSKYSYLNFRFGTKSEVTDL